MTETSMQPEELDFATKDVKSFRNYDDSYRQATVEQHYKLMRSNQTLAFSKKMIEKYSFEHPRKEMTIREAFVFLETYVDSSDPDVHLPNLVHMFQAAEGIRKKGHPDWMQLVGLIHDMGKIMFLWGNDEDGQVGTADGPQWALGGDTWVVGCKLPDEAMVFPQFNVLNPDIKDERYNTEKGIYQEHCGMSTVNYAFGHDEYLYRMVMANKTTIPEEGLAMIRYHSCYPWHTGGAYRILMNERDHELIPWVTEFNKFDLYTKENNDIPNVEELWPYYEELIRKYFPNPVLEW
jgi:inositol oxygenase